MSRVNLSHAADYHKRTSLKKTALQKTHYENRNMAVLVQKYKVLKSGQSRSSSMLIKPATIMLQPLSYMRNERIKYRWERVKVHCLFFKMFLASIFSSFLLQNITRAKIKSLLTTRSHKNAMIDPWNKPFHENTFLLRSTKQIFRNCKV